MIEHVAVASSRGAPSQCCHQSGDKFLCQLLDICFTRIGEQGSQFFITRYMVCHHQVLVAAIKCHQLVRTDTLRQQLLPGMVGVGPGDKAFPESRVIKAAVIFQWQQRIGLEERGCEYTFLIRGDAMPVHGVAFHPVVPATGATLDEDVSA